MLSKNRIILIPERKTFAPKKTNVKDMRTQIGAIEHKHSQSSFVFSKTQRVLIVKIDLGNGLVVTQKVVR